MRPACCRKKLTILAPTLQFLQRISEWRGDSIRKSNRVVLRIEALASPKADEDASMQLGRSGCALTAGLEMKFNLRGSWNS
jgi:hypothetical protein